MPRRKTNRRSQAAIEFVRLLFGGNGAWRYMNTFDGFGIVVSEVHSAHVDPVIESIPVNRALQDVGVSLRAVAVPHGMMPAVAFRIQCADESIVFSGDISTSTPAFVDLARNCSMLIHDFALPERDVPHGKLHAKPSAVGRTAQLSGAASLVLSHFMPAIEDELIDAVGVVRREFDGRIEIARDLATYEVPLRS